MGRRQVIEGLVESLRQAGGFDAASSGTVLAGDQRMTATGVDRAAIVLPNRSEHSVMAIGRQRRIDWHLDVAVMIRHNNDVVAARQDADTYLQSLIDRVAADPTLGGSAFDAVVTETRVEDEAMRIGSLHYLMEVMTVRATETLP